MSDPANSITLVFHPDMTDEQIESAIKVINDLFEAAGGKGGLRVERVNEAGEVIGGPNEFCRHGRRFCGPCDVDENEKRAR